jgi:formylglycine-generating enzyme
VKVKILELARYVIAVILVVTTEGLADVFNMNGSLISLKTVRVGNAGNDGQWSGKSYGGNGPDRICGAVSYEYDIGKYEVTAGQYCEFLNAVAGTDTYGLYNAYMWSSSEGCKIERYAGNGTTADPYQYRVAADWANRPVNYVSWADATRFANWLHKGQPMGSQDLTTTEDGSYYLNGATSNEALFAMRRHSRIYNASYEMRIFL